MRIYTRTGDKGQTGLLGGGRVGKDSSRISTYGTVDECNAVIGIALCHDLGQPLTQMLTKIQNKLFVVGADLATPEDKKTRIDRINRDDVGQLEEWIDQLEESLSPIKQFILPGGCRGASFLHLARTVCRRAERWAVTLVREESANPQATVYLNRLSDFLFVAARTANKQAGIPDRFWEKPDRKSKK